MSKTVTRELSTTNKMVVAARKAGQPVPSDFVYQGYEGAVDGDISVKVDVEVFESLEEACGEDFYGSEKVAIDALSEDWIKRCLNTARPVLREAEKPLDWQGVAQLAINGYKPGKKGGFQPRVTEAEIDQIDDLEQLKELLRKRGAVAA